MAATAIKNLTRTPLLLLAAVEAAVLYSSVYFATFSLCANATNCEHFVGSLPAHAVQVAIVLLICLIAMGLYQLHQRMSFREVFLRLFVGISLGSFVLAVIFYLTSPTYLSKSIVSLSAIYSFCLLSLIRLFFVRNVDQNIFRRKTLIYGSGERAESIADLRRQADRRGFKVVGTVPERTGESGNWRLPNGSSDRSLLNMALETGAEEIVIAMDDRRGKLPIRELLDCRLRGIEVIDIIEFLERETGKIRVDLVSPGWLIFSEGFRKTRIRLVTKRMTDLLLSTTAFFIGWPFLLLIALAIKAEGGLRSPVLYKQQRVGLNAVPFNVLKFRSMRVDAEADGRAVWAAENDNRITKVGQFIRKLRFDELPQIINVIRGQMSIVGPRPERPEFVERLSESIPYYAERHTVKPGITGWAQLRYAYGSSEEDAIEKLQFDLYYVKNHTLLLDLLIILQTAEVVLWGKGAR
jgi:sugar transferase (PEP-CTERM system associated)